MTHGSFTWVIIINVFNIIIFSFSANAPFLAETKKKYRVVQKNAPICLCT